MEEPAQSSSVSKKWKRKVSRSLVARWAAAEEEKGCVRCPFRDCVHCAKSVEEMKSHFVLCDGGDSGGKLKCPYCGRQSDSAVSLNEHVRLSHYNFGAVISKLKKSTEKPLVEEEAMPAPNTEKPVVEEEAVSAPIEEKPVVEEEALSAPSIEKPVVVEEAVSAPNEKEDASKTVLIFKPAPKNPLVVEEKSLSRNAYVRKRAFHKSHIKSWEIFLDKDGFIRCHLQGCKFIAQSIEEMKAHYGYCTAKNTNTPYECPFCKGLTTSAELLNTHIQRAHLDAKRFVATVIDSGPKMKSEDGCLNSSDENIINMKVLLVEWRSNGYLRCSYDCNTISKKLFPLIHHLGSCKKAPPQFSAVCVCGFVSQNSLTFLHHTQTCDAIEFHVKNVNNYNFDFQIAEDVLNAWSNLIEEEGFVRCNRCSCLTFHVCGTAQHHSACLKESMTVEKFECPFCTGWTKSLDSLIKHVFFSHPTNSRYAVVIRPESSEPVITVESSYFKIHNEFICQYCEKRFADVPDIQNHMNQDHSITQESNFYSLVDIWKAQIEANNLCICPKYPCLFATDTISEIMKHFTKCEWENTSNALRLSANERSRNQPVSLEKDPNHPTKEISCDLPSTNAATVRNTSHDIDIHLTQTKRNKKEPVSCRLTSFQGEVKPSVKRNLPLLKSILKRKKSARNKVNMSTNSVEEVTITKTFLNQVNRAIKRSTEEASEVKTTLTVIPENVFNISNSLASNVSSTVVCEQPTFENKKAPGVGNRTIHKKRFEVIKPNLKIKRNRAPVEAKPAFKASQSERKRVSNSNSSSDKLCNEKIDTQEVAIYALADIVCCGACGLEMTYDIYSKKHRFVHYGLCWIVGEKPVDFNDENHCLNLLSSYQSQFLKRNKKENFFRCFICRTTKLSASQHLAHLKTCLMKEDSIFLESGSSISSGRTGIRLNKSGTEFIEVACRDNGTGDTVVLSEDAVITESTLVPVSGVAGSERMISYDDSGEFMVSEEVVLSDIPFEANDGILCGAVVYSSDADHSSAIEEVEFLNEDSQNSETTYAYDCEVSDQDDCHTEMQESLVEDRAVSISPSNELLKLDTGMIGLGQSNASSKLCRTSINVSNNVSTLDTEGIVAENEQIGGMSISSEVVVANGVKESVLIESEISENQMTYQESGSVAFTGMYQANYSEDECLVLKPVSVVSQTSNVGHECKHIESVEPVAKRTEHLIEGSANLDVAQTRNVSCDPKHVGDIDSVVEKSVVDDAELNMPNSSMDELIAVEPVSNIPQTSDMNCNPDHVNNIEPLVKRNETLVDDGTRLQTSKYSPCDIIKCGACGQEMMYSVYEQNHKEEHYSLCWIEGETRIDFANDALCVSILKEYQSPVNNREELEAVKFFRCLKCYENQKGVKEHLKHLRACFSRRESNFKNPRLSSCEKENWNEKIKTCPKSEVKNFDFKDSCKQFNRKTTFSSSDIVKCGMCKEEMTYDIYVKKHKEKHFKLCWIEGETPLNFFDEKRCMNTLMKYQSLFTKSKKKSNPKFFSCFKCKQNHKSAPSHLRHLIVCVVKNEFKNKRHTTATEESMMNQDSQSRIDFEGNFDTPHKNGHSSVSQVNHKEATEIDSRTGSTCKSNENLQEASNQTKDVGVSHSKASNLEGKESESVISYEQITANQSMVKTLQDQLKIKADSDKNNEVVKSVEYSDSVSKETSLVKSKMPTIGEVNNKITDESVSSCSKPAARYISQDGNVKEIMYEGKISKTNSEVVFESSFKVYNCPIEKPGCNRSTNKEVAEITAESEISSGSPNTSEEIICFDKFPSTRTDLKNAGMEKSFEMICPPIKKAGRGRPRKKSVPEENIEIGNKEPLKNTVFSEEITSTASFKSTYLAVKRTEGSDNNLSEEIDPQNRKASRGRPKKKASIENIGQEINKFTEVATILADDFCINHSQETRIGPEKIQSNRNSLDTQRKKDGRGRPKKKVPVENLKKGSEELVRSTICSEASFRLRENEESSCSSETAQSKETTPNISDINPKKAGRGRPKNKICTEIVEKESHKSVENKVFPEVSSCSSPAHKRKISSESVQNEENVLNISDTQNKKAGRGRPKNKICTEIVEEESQKSVESKVFPEVSSCSSPAHKRKISCGSVRNEENVLNISDTQNKKAGRGRPKNKICTEIVEENIQKSVESKVFSRISSCSSPAHKRRISSESVPNEENVLNISDTQNKKTGRGRPKKKVSLQKVKSEELFESKVFPEVSSCSSPAHQRRISSESVQNEENVLNISDTQNKKAGRGRPTKKVSLQKMKSEELFESTVIREVSSCSSPAHKRRISSESVQNEENVLNISDTQNKKAGRGRPKKKVSLENVKSEELFESKAFPEVSSCSSPAHKRRITSESVQNEENVLNISDTQNKKAGRGRPKKKVSLEKVKSEELFESTVIQEVSSCSNQTQERRISSETVQSKESASNICKIHNKKAGRGRPKEKVPDENIKKDNKDVVESLVNSEVSLCLNQSQNRRISVEDGQSEENVPNVSDIQNKIAGRGRPKKNISIRNVEQCNALIKKIENPEAMCSSQSRGRRVSGEKSHSDKDPLDLSDVQIKKAGRGRPKKDMSSPGFIMCQSQSVDRRVSGEKSNSDKDPLYLSNVQIKKTGRGRPKKNMPPEFVTCSSQFEDRRRSEEMIHNDEDPLKTDNFQIKKAGWGRPKKAAVKKETREKDIEVANAAEILTRGINKGKRKRESTSERNVEEIYGKSSDVAGSSTKRYRCSRSKTEDLFEENDEILYKNTTFKEKGTHPGQFSKKRRSATSKQNKGAENYEESDEGFDVSTFEDMDEEEYLPLRKPQRGRTKRKRSFKREFGTQKPKKEVIDDEGAPDVEENSKYALSDSVKCGACEEEMTYEVYLQHREKHFKLCWIEGETPIDLFDDKVVMKILNKYQSLFIRLRKKRRITRVYRCFKCDNVQKSSIGHISHLRECIVKEEDKFKGLAACEHCGHFLKRSSMNSHKKMCAAFLAERTIAEFGTPPVFEKSRRSAAVKAEKVMKKLRDSLMGTEDDRVTQADSDEDADFKVADGDEEDHEDSGEEKEGLIQLQKRIIPHFRKRQTRISTSLLRSWEAALSKGAEGTCIVPGCTFRSVDFDTLKSHFQNCPLSMRNEFFCQDCPFKTEHIGEIETHVQTVHGFVITHSANSVFEKKTNIIFNLYPSPEDSRFVDTHINKLDFTYKWSLKFVKEKLSESHTFEFLKDNLELSPVENEKLCNYLPKCRESVTVFSDNNESSQFQLFQSQSEKSLVKIFVGGPIWALAWAPTSVVQSRQFLAVSTHPSMDSVYTRKNTTMHHGLIQIWEFPCLNNLYPKTDDPKLALAITHDFGTAWSMEWCPSAKMPRERIGLLAVAFSSGVAVVYSIPGPENLPESASRYPIYKLKPSLILDLSTSGTAQCTRIAWQRVKPHNMLVAGYSNGFVGVWDVDTTSPLLKQGDILFPHQVFQPHLCPITGLQFGAVGENRYIATVASDRCGVYCWDLKDTSSPIFHTVRTKARNNPLMTDLVWPNHWLSLVTSSDDAFNLGSAAQLNALREFNFSVETLMPQTAVNWNLSYSEWTGSIVISAGDGSVFMVAPGQLLRMIDQKNRNIKRRIMITNVIEKSTLTVVDRSKKKKKTFELKPLTYPEAAEKYGVKFTPVMEPFKIKTNNNARPQASNEMNFYPLQSVNKVAWNPNCQSFLWLALGYQNGFLCLSHKDIIRTRTLEDYYSLL